MHAGLLSCDKCGRRLAVAYRGHEPRQPVYRCNGPNQKFALPRCLSFGGRRVDQAAARELLKAVEPMAFEAAMQAERRYVQMRGEQQRIVELELQRATYETALAERRYAACDPFRTAGCAARYPLLSRGRSTSPSRSCSRPAPKRQAAAYRTRILTRLAPCYD